MVATPRLCLSRSVLFPPLAGNQRGGGGTYRSQDSPIVREKVANVLDVQLHFFGILKSLPGVVVLLVTLVISFLAAAALIGGRCLALARRNQRRGQPELPHPHQYAHYHSPPILPLRFI